jgi:hypothetical protein
LSSSEGHQGTEIDFFLNSTWETEGWEQCEEGFLASLLVVQSVVVPQYCSFSHRSLKGCKVTLRGHRLVTSKPCHLTLSMDPCPGLCKGEDGSPHCVVRIDRLKKLQ